MRRMSLVTLVSLFVLGTLAGPSQAYPRPGRTILVSGPSFNGDPASGSNPRISGDGRVVSFVSGSALLPGDSNGFADCYARDLSTGVLTRISLAHDGSEPNAVCGSAQLSETGRYAAWASTATNLVPGDTNGVSDIFVRDLQEGTTTRVSVSSQEAQAGGASTLAQISDDGRTVAFLSDATNLVPNDTNAFNDVFVRDLDAGTTERVTVSSEGAEGVTALANYMLAGNGRHVVFTHRMPWDGDRSSYDDIFVHDLVTKLTELVSVATDGSQPNGNSFNPSISDDGRYVAFGSFGTNLVAHDFNGAADPFVRDRQTGVTERVSMPSTGEESNHVVGIPVISGNGRYVTGNHLPTNYGYQDDNGNTDVYVYDRSTGAIELASGTPDGGSTGNGFSMSPVISDDGRRAAFQSQATDLIENGPSGMQVYVRDMGPSLGTGGLAASDEATDVAVSGFARIAGARLLDVADPRNDGVPAAGVELIGASATYRPEEEDVFLRLDLAPRTHFWAPLLGTTARKPGAVTYGWELGIGGVRHEVRATQTAAPTGATFALFRCEAACTQVESLRGGDGTVGDAVAVSVPVAKLGGEGASLAFTQAWAAAGEANTGPLRVLDDVALQSAMIPNVEVTLGVAATGTSPGDVTFDTRASLDRGRFSERLPKGNGAREAWARVCLGSECHTSKVGVS